MLILSTSSNAQSFQWLARMGGPDPDPNFGPDEMVKDIQVDADGNVYACGKIRSIADFDGTAVTTYGFYDIFLSKYNCHGNLVWVKTAGSGFDDEAISLKLDNLGHIYLLGDMQASTFKPCTFFDTIVVATTNGMFLAKFDTSGNRIWSEYAGGGSNTFFSYPYRLELDNNGKPAVFVSCNFGGGATSGELYPGFNLPEGVYITNFDTSGLMVKATSVMQINFVGELSNFKINSKNESIISGDFSSDSATFQNQTIYNPKQEDKAFICKYDSLGSLLWTYQFTDTSSTTAYTSCKGLCVDSNDNIYASGAAQPGIQFGSYVFTDSIPPYSVSPYVIKLSTNGTPIWASQGKSSGGAEAEGGIAIKSNGNIVTSGFYWNNIAIFANDTLTQTTPGIQDMFIAEIDANGQMLGAVRVGGTGSNEESFCTAVDANQNVYIAGCFDNSLYINNVYTSVAGGYTDGFIVKYGTPCTTGIEENQLSNSNNILVYPNPARDQVMLKLNEYIISGTIQIINIQGKVVFENKINNQNSYLVDINNFSQGMYLVRITDAKNVRVTKFIKE